jgi:N-dimethylarginine dimethylaminohydrolase
MLSEHEAFAELLEDAGAEVVLAEGPIGVCPDAIYVFDPAIVAADGAILMRPGKEGRRAEVDAIAVDLASAGVRIAGRLEAPATADGGDTAWLDERTLLVGRGYRTNDAGVEALRRLLPGVDVIGFDLPHLRGAAHVLHLLSLFSLLDEGLAVAYPPLMPVRLMELFAQRGIQIVEVPDEEFDSMGPNVLAVGPRAAIALEGNPVTRARLEAAGVDLAVYDGEEISRKGDGGPMCLTRPLLRG